MYIGLFAGGFKPFTSGHYHVLRKASEENDQVYVFASTKDRLRKDEYPIFFKDLKFYWNLIRSILPKNVKIIFSEVPTTDQFQILDQAENDPDNLDVFTIYADASDIKRYDNPRVRDRSHKRLYHSDQLLFHPIDRISGVDVSATKMRKALQDSNPEEFTKMLPDPLKQKGYEIYKSLGGK